MSMQENKSKTQNRINAYFVAIVYKQIDGIYGNKQNQRKRERETEKHQHVHFFIRLNYCKSL